MALAHAGLGLAVLGVTVVTASGVERDVRLAPGERAELAGHSFEFASAHSLAGPNYDAVEAEFRVTTPGGRTFALRPEKRTYRAQGGSMTEAAIAPGLSRDVYVALGEPLENGAWAVRLQYKPFVRFIWLGALVMALGGLLALADRRYRRDGARGDPAETAP
jgi:cytochrome c-type biogenesis protein CcmF